MDYVVIVAGGKGLRMGADVPKQFLPIGGLPVLMRTMLRFREAMPGLNIILVLPKAQQDYWCELCRQYDFRVEYQLADGGETRFHSVQNGLALVPDEAEGVVGVHDGVRPFVSVEVIRQCYEEARSRKAVIPVVPVVETLRHIKPTPNPSRGEGSLDSSATPRSSSKSNQASESNQAPLPSGGAGGGDSSATPRSSSKSNQASESNQAPLPSGGAGGGSTVPRDEYRLVQTPQCFDIQLLKAANRQPYQDSFTDDASVVEHYGHEIFLVDGNRENIKITTPYDLKIAEVLI